jgi:hypothetical protein
MSTKTRRWQIVAVVSATAVLAGASVSATPPSAKGAAGGQTLKKAVWGPPEVNGTSLFPRYRDLGIGIYQVDLRWDRVALRRPADPTDPADPAYSWSADQTEAIDEAVANGMQVAIRIMGTPAWANGDRSPRWVPNSPSDYAQFAVAAARRYPAARLWIVWGEPNRESNFAPLTPAKFTGPLTKAQQVAPRNYAELLDAAYGALKGLNPANLIVGGSTFASQGARVIHPYQWIRYMKLPDGSRPRMDLYGHNPFSYREPTLDAPPSPKGRVEFSDLRRFGKALDRYFPGKHLRFFLSEWGVQAGGKDVSPGFKVSPVTQAKWIRAAYSIARSWGRIYTLGWVHALDTDISGGGLMDINGNPKPAYYVFKGS